MLLSRKNKKRAAKSALRRLRIPSKLDALCGANANPRLRVSHCSKIQAICYAQTKTFYPHLGNFAYGEYFAPCRRHVQARASLYGANANPCG
jgi:hypothetical protein